MKTWTIILGLVVIVGAWLVGFGFFSSWLDTPLNEPMPLNPPGTIDTEIVIPLRERYYLELEFDRAGFSFGELNDLLGAKPDEGIPTRIAWSLRSTKTGLIVAGESKATTGAYGWSNATVSRMIATVEVEPGVYRFVAEALEPAPRLSSLTTRLTMRVDSKFFTTWQMAVVWGVSLINYFLVLPLLVGLIAYLVVAAIRHLTSHSTPDAQKARAG